MTLDRTPLRWLAAPLTAAIVALGVWVTGGVLTNDFKSSVVLVGAWFAVAALVSLVIGIKRRGLRVPVIGAYLVSAAAIGAYLGYSTLHDRVAHEKVVTGVPAASVPAASREHRNIQLSTGTFESLEHDSRGRATVVRLADGSRKLTLTGFSTAAGPDLRVRLVIGDTSDGGSAGAKDLGGLKGNKGDQQYDIPRAVDLSRYTTVVIWCRAFSAGFAKATLSPSG